jgi:hypothetical protein
MALTKSLANVIFFKEIFITSSKINKIYLANIRG